MGEKQGHTGWKADCGFHRLGTGLPCSVRLTSGSIKVKTEAEARLIAAAPDLLEALIKALPYVECAEDDPAYKAGAVAKVVKNMRAALAKARQSEGDQ